MPSWMKHESLWKTSRTHSAQWNMEIQYVECEMGVGCRTITGFDYRQAGGRYVLHKDSARSTKNNNII
jgi:hypothetical protein